MSLSALLQRPRAIVSMVLPLAAALGVVSTTAAHAAYTFTFSNTTATVGLDRTVTASTTIKASAEGAYVQYASVCGRDAAGNIVDFPLVQNVQIDSVNGTTLTRSRTLSPGTYTYFGLVA